MSTPPTLHIAEPLTAESLHALIPKLSPEGIARYLTAQRWFGDKSRTVTTTSPLSWSVAKLDGEFILLLLVRVHFETGEPVDYFVPAMVMRSPSPGEPFASISAENDAWQVSDAISNPSFRSWLIQRLADGTSDETGRFRWSSLPSALPSAQHLRQLPSRVSSAQQSNTSIVYGNDIILKVFRRLSTGINPEIELGRFLTNETSFRNMPLLLGEWSVTAPGEPPLSIAVAQSFVPSVGDGWSYLLEAIRSDRESTGEAIGRLGQVTAQMHLALASATQDDNLRAELIDEHDVERWKSATSEAIRETANALSPIVERYTGETRELIDAFLAQLSPMLNRVSGFDRLVSSTKTRVHGDYHLGQTLRTEDDFVILDFEGEPQRPISERRLKTSPLKDVAGMLRSFSYARGVVERDDSGVSVADLVAWERAVRRAFLDHYVSESRQGGATYLPASDDDVRQAIAAWELEKALYEVRYELNSRPDWLALPLAATLKLS